MQKCGGGAKDRARGWRRQREEWRLLRSGSLEAGGKKGAGLGVGEGDELEGASGAGDFAEDAFGDEIIDMFGDGGDGGEDRGRS